MNDITALTPVTPEMLASLKLSAMNLAEGEMMSFEPAVFRALVEALEAKEKQRAAANKVVIQQDIELNELRQRVADLESRTVTVKWPTPKDASQGWKIDPEFICKVQGAIGYDEEEGTPSMEVIETVLLAAGIQVIEGEGQ